MKDIDSNLNQNIQKLTNVTKVSSLVFGETIPATNTNMYTVPANLTAKLTEILLFNSTGSAVTVNLFLVPSGATPDATKNKIYGAAVAGGASATLTLGTSLPGGANIYASASTGSVAGIFISGILQSK